MGVLVEFERYKAEIEIRFPKGKVSCEWCNMSYRNRKGHIECALTGEEMVSPENSIGFECPGRGGIDGI